MVSETTPPYADSMPLVILAITVPLALVVVVAIVHAALTNTGGTRRRPPTPTPCSSPQLLAPHDDR